MPQPVSRYAHYPVAALVTLGFGFGTLVLPSGSVLRALVALPFIFIMPGYALREALMPRDEHSGSVRIAYLVALSLIATLLGGVILNIFPSGLTTRSWVVWICSVTLGGLGIATFRSPATVNDRTAWITVQHVTLFSLALLITAAAFWVARSSFAASDVPLTELWMVQTATGEVQLGLRNQERATMEYRVVLQENGQQRDQWDAITLAPGEEWTTSIPAIGTDPRLDALLYRIDRPTELYRRVQLAPGRAASNAEVRTSGSSSPSARTP